MREYLFRAKLVKNGEWTYGNLRVMPDNTYIITPDETIIGEYGKVCSESVGQYIGLTDKNGRKIFEGDIATDKKGRTGLIVYNHQTLSFECSKPKKWGVWYTLGVDKSWEVIGNIHDNTELLEKE